MPERLGHNVDLSPRLSGDIGRAGQLFEQPLLPLQLGGQLPQVAVIGVDLLESWMRVDALNFRLQLLNARLYPGNFTDG
jgi:hypothetical protein